MDFFQCPSCGGRLEKTEQFKICKFCGSKWDNELDVDESRLFLHDAWSALRDGDFEKAAELFESIIAKKSTHHEAYWGRALAMGGIVYVTDMNENKKVPTCNNITEESFIQNKDVQKAISLAPAAIAEGYQQQAKYIESVRVEWLQKASKEPAYDVFISFKDSDREHGIERTQDSIDAQDLYNALVAEGYKVFFSRISLRDKIAEQYEPYIYNAIKTAKVMIVFGEKPEYFSAVWIKNEWSRFKTRIEKGEKHKNALVVVYKGMSPADLPVVLKSRQCLNAADMTFLSDLTRHIKRVVEESKQIAHLDRIEIKGGQMAKKATTLSVNSVQTREIGSGAIAETSISEKQSLDLVRSYMHAKQWEDAQKILEDILFNNPACADAIWQKLLCRNRISKNEDLYSKFQSFTQEDYGLIEKTINCSNKEQAAELLNFLYANSTHAFIAEEIQKRILELILPYNFENREQFIQETFAFAISKQRFSVFQLLLSTLPKENVDQYIQYNLKYAFSTHNAEHKANCLNAVLSVDAGNLEALKMLFDLQWDGADSTRLTQTFEEILKYSPKPQNEVAQALNHAVETLHTYEQCLFAKQALKYFSGDLAALQQPLFDLAYRMLKYDFFDDALYLFGLILSFDPNNVDVYWGICLAKIKVSSEKAVLSSNIFIKDIPEYTKYLTMVNEDRRQVCMALAKKQEKAMQTRKKAKKTKIICAAIAAFAVLVFAFVQIYIHVIAPSVSYKKAVTLMEDGKYDEAIAIFDGLQDYKDSEVMILQCQYEQAVALMNALQYSDAISALENLHGYQDSDALLEQCKYSQAISLMEEEKYTAAQTILQTLRSSERKIGLQAIINAVEQIEMLPTQQILQNVTAEGESVTVRYDANGGTVTEQTVRYTSDNTSLSVPTRLGYVFVEWEMTEYGYSAEDSLSISLKAVWNGEYTIEYDLANGSAENPTDYSKEGEEIVLNNPTKEGYTFIGWTGTDLDALTMRVVIPAGSYGNRTYTANWQANEYTFALNANGGTLTEESLSASYHSPYTLPIPAREYYTFAGWYDGSIKYENGLWQEANNVTLTAHWTPVTYAVTYHLDDGTNSTQNKAEFTVESSTVTLVPPSKTGYEFLGWYRDSTYAELITEIPTGSHGDLNLYAKWEIITYTITYDLNGGTESEPLPTSFTVQDLPLTLPTSTKTDLSFLYWTKDSLDGTVIRQVSEVGDISLTAVYIDSGLNFTLSDTENYYKVSSYTGSADHVDIPSYYFEKPVTEIGNQAFMDCTLKSITIPNSITIIGEEAFKYCSSLTDITIPDSVTSIGKNAFYWCSSLTSITIPDSVTSIGYSAFYKCIALTTMTIPYIDSFFGVLFGATMYTDNGTYVPSSLKNVIITGGTTIGDHSFYNCYNLMNITIPDSVTSIGGYAFDDCRNLTSIIIPDSVTSIGYHAFEECSSLTSITIGTGVTNISLKGCRNLTNIVVKEGNTTYHSVGNCLIQTQTKTLIKGCKTSVIPDDGSVRSIGEWAFEYCDALTSIVIPTSVTHIADYAFVGCRELTSITFTGTKAQWEAISKEAWWDYGSYYYTIYCTDGNISN